MIFKRVCRLAYHSKIFVTTLLFPPPSIYLYLSVAEMEMSTLVENFMASKLRIGFVETSNIPVDKMSI